MIPSVLDVNNAARAHLGDTEVFGGQLFTDSFLQPFFASAYQSLYTWLERNGGSKLRRTQFYNLPAYTGYLKPDSIGISNIGNPINIWDRPIGVALTSTVAALNAASPSTGGIPSIDLTATNHGLLAGQEVIVFGFVDGTVTDSINDIWYISVPNSNTIRLNGVESGASDTLGATGITTTGSADWPVQPLRQLWDFTAENTNSGQSAALSWWHWAGSAFRFAPANTARQIKITYELSGDAPSNGPIGLDDSLNALSAMTGALAARAKGFPQKAESLFVAAVGNAAGDTTNIRGGYFAEMAQIEARQSQMTRVIVPRYRRKRNTGPTAYSW